MEYLLWGRMIMKHAIMGIEYVNIYWCEIECYVY